MSRLKTQHISLLGYFCLFVLFAADFAVCLVMMDFARFSWIFAALVCSLGHSTALRSFVKAEAVECVQKCSDRPGLRWARVIASLAI